jgi:hypothetical protein
MDFITTIIRTLSRRLTMPTWVREAAYDVGAHRETEPYGSGLRLYVDGRLEGWIEGVERL